MHVPVVQSVFVLQSCVQVPPAPASAESAMQA
jgi:hypothetical protein